MISENIHDERAEVLPTDYFTMLLSANFKMVGPLLTIPFSIINGRRAPKLLVYFQMVRAIQAVYGHRPLTV